MMLCEWCNVQAVCATTTSETLYTQLFLSRSCNSSLQHSIRRRAFLPNPLHEYANSQTRRADDRRVTLTANKWHFSKITIHHLFNHTIWSDGFHCSSATPNNHDSQSGYIQKDASSSNPFSTPPLGREKQKRLQTIESGIALNEAAKRSLEGGNMIIDVENTSPD